MTLKDRIRFIAGSRGMSIAELSREMGISSTLLYRKLNKEKLSYKDAEKIAGICEYRIAWVDIKKPEKGKIFDT